MTTAIDTIDQVELTEFSRMVADEFDQAASGTLADIFPVDPLNDIRYGYDRFDDLLLDDAPYRAWDAESPMGRRPGGARITGEILPISRKIPLKEYAQIRLRGGSASDIVDAIYRDTERLSREVWARIIKARGELITTGSIVINENGVKSTYASGRHGTLTVGAVSPLWSAASTATPVANVRAWKELVRLQSGQTPDTLSLSETAFAALQACDEVKDLAFPNGYAGSIMTDGDVRRVFAQPAFGGVELRIRQEVPHVASQPVDDSVVILYKRNVPIGLTAVGTPLESVKPEYQSVAQKAGLYAGGWKSDDPMTAWTHVVGIGLPLMPAPNLTLSAQVLT